MIMSPWAMPHIKAMTTNDLTVSLTDPLEAAKGGLTVGCEFVKYLTIDGIQSWYGLYNLTPSDREKLQGRASR